MNFLKKMQIQQNSLKIKRKTLIKDKEDKNKHPLINIYLINYLTWSQLPWRFKTLCDRPTSPKPFFLFIRNSVRI